MKIPTEIVQTEYGDLIVLSKDVGQSTAFRQSGVGVEWQEIEMLNELVGRINNPVFFDIGANLGAFTFGLAKTIKERNGFICSFEPQRIIYNCLAGSVALNGYDNIFTYNVAVGKSQEKSIEMPLFDYTQNCSFGSIEFGSKQVEELSQKRQEDGKRESVSIIPLDGFTNKISKLDLLKIDVEGMEESVLESSRELISKHKPILFIEFLKSDKEKLKKIIEELGYNEIREIGINFFCSVK